MWRCAVKSVNKLPCLLLVGALTASVLNARAADAVVSFPGDQSDLLAPNGKLRIVNRDPSDSDHLHELFLREQGKPDKKVYSYSRHVRVAWAPDSKHLFVTDYVGSTDSTCVLIDVATNIRTDLGLKAKKLPGQVSVILSNPHEYLECVRWLSGPEVLVLVHGYGGSQAGEQSATLKYVLGSGFDGPPAGHDN
jgi:hypothetical protein